MTSELYDSSDYNDQINLSGGGFTEVVFPVCVILYFYPTYMLEGNVAQL